MKIIDSFDGEYYFLSNFFPKKFTYNGEIFETSEHAFQMEKTIIPEEREKIKNAYSPGSAKKLGRKCTIREDWDKIKIKVMIDVVWAKFQDEELKKKLIDTGDAELVEGNYWNDTFWGVCNGVGQNHLGKILMDVRRHILSNDKMLKEWIEEGKDPEKFTAYSMPVDPQGIEWAKKEIKNIVHNMTADTPIGWQSYDHNQRFFKPN